MFRTKTIHADAQFPGFDVQYTGNAMPTRPAKHNVRNLTGLYLGTVSICTLQFFFLKTSDFKMCRTKYRIAMRHGIKT